MPTPNGLWTPTEVKDEELRNLGVDGYIHQTTGLLLPDSDEANKIIADGLDQGLRVVRFQPYPRTKRG
jgi:hypothetical protein